MARSISGGVEVCGDALAVEALSTLRVRAAGGRGAPAPTARSQDPTATGHRGPPRPSPHPCGRRRRGALPLTAACAWPTRGCGAAAGAPPPYAAAGLVQVPAVGSRQCTVLSIDWRAAASPPKR